MSKIAVDPYLFFKGNAREALEFYQSVFGGKIDAMTYKDTNMELTGDLKETDLMHGYLSGGDVTLMVSDTAQASERSAKIVISLSGDDEERLTKYFNELSDGAEVEQPLKKEFWGDIFGSVRDKFGVEWMVNISQTKKDTAKA